jgi:hypothetical protein
VGGHKTEESKQSRFAVCHFESGEGPGNEVANRKVATKIVGSSFPISQSQIFYLAFFISHLAFFNSHLAFLSRISHFFISHLAFLCRI